MADSRIQHKEDCKRKLSKPADLCECNSKWGGIAEGSRALAAAALHWNTQDTGTPLSEVLEAELRRRVEPLLEKADKVLFIAAEHVSPTLADDLRKEIHSWRK